MSGLTTFRCIIEAEQGESKLVVRSAAVTEGMTLGEMADAFGEFSSVTDHFAKTAFDVRQAHNRRLNECALEE